MKYFWNRKAQIAKRNLEIEREELKSSLIIVENSCSGSSGMMADRVIQEYMLSYVADNCDEDYHSFAQEPCSQIWHLAYHQLHELVHDYNDEIRKQIKLIESILFAPKKYNYQINKRSAYRALIHAMFKTLDDESEVNYLSVQNKSVINKFTLISNTNERERISSENKFHHSFEKCSAF